MSKATGRKRWLEKVDAVQREYQLHKRNEGTNDGWIWRVFIAPKFFIGYRTMKNYLEIPAKRELSKLESCEQSASQIS